jgi:sulfate/thiosulfate-binding protein
LKYILCFIISLCCSLALAEPQQSILNVSYDPTRELFKQINEAFNKHRIKHGLSIADIKQSHAGSGRQALAVMNGLEADIVTLALDYDIDMMADKGLLSHNWRQQFPNNSSPYSSIIVFMVRKGNPKQIKDWSDLIRKDISVITPNPKSSGGARVNYLAAWHYAMSKHHNNEAAAKEFMHKLYKNVHMLDVSSRSAMITFTKRNIGDVVIAWENEALLAKRYHNDEGYDIVIPPMTLEIPLPIAIVDHYANKHNTYNMAKAYLDFLYTDTAQNIIADNHYHNYKNQQKSNIPKLHQLGKLQDIYNKHFSEGGLFDQIFLKPL